MSFYRWQDFQCTNFGNCSRADLYEIIDLPLGAEPVCPECGQAVIPMRPREIVMISPPVNARVRKRRLPWLLAPVAIAALILGLTAGVVWPLMRASERLSLTIPTHVAAQVDDSLQIPLTVEPSQVSGLTFTIKGTLPPGVSLDGSGRRLYGVPQSAGSFYVAITAQAPHLASATAAMGIIIERRPVFLATDLSLQAPSTVQGRVGVPLSIPITISPDSASEPILTMEGSPPPGVTLDAPGKRLLGTPQRPGSYAVIIRASAREYMPAVATVAFTISEALPSPTPAQQVQAPVQAQVKAPVQAQPQPHPTSTPVEMPDLILAGSSAMGDADAASGKGLGRDLAIAFCQQEWPGGSLVNEQPKDARQDEGDHLLIYKLPTGELHRILIQPHGSRMAVAALTAADPNRRADVGMSSSPLPELDKGFSAVIIALDAVAVIVHPDNPIRELTLEQLRNIFGPNPTVTRWEDGNPIQTYGPDRKSGTTECFRAVTGIDQALEALKRARDDAIPYSGISNGQPGREGYEDPSKVVERVSANRYAIGYVGRGVKVPASVRGVAIRPEPSAPAFSPSAATVRTMDYCMVRELFLYAATTNTRPLAARFVRFCLSDGGQKVVNDDGFIRFRTEDLLAPPVLANRAPAALRRAVTNCDRVVISVRFRKGVSDALDAVSAQNFKRLVDFLHKPEVSTRHLTLVGSADGTGTRSASALQSRQRAETLAALLTNAGVENPIDQKLGFGKDYALDDDRADPNSREAAQPNGRVDVYLRR